MKRIRWAAALLLALLCLLGAAAAESARVLTPGGKLNLRRSASDKAKLVAYVPNRSLVDVQEIDGDWARITYKKYSGWVKTEYLKLPEALAGRTVYSDGETLILRESPDPKAAPLAAASRAESVTVLAVEAGWAQVRNNGAMGNGMVGYVETAALSYQLEAAADGPDWIAEEGRMARDGRFPAGTPVTVGPVTGKECLVLAEGGCGYEPVDSVQLKGVAEDEAAVDAEASAAVSAASASLKKRYKAFSKESLFYLAKPVGDGVWRCAFLSENGQYRYGALVEGKKAVFLGDYTAFAVPAVRAENLLPEGQMKLSLSRETLAVGEVLDVTVEAWTRHQASYTLLLDGKKVFSGEPSGHFEAAYRPRKAGSYTLRVEVKDAGGKSAADEAGFTVTAAEEQETPAVWSQKDGWWKDKRYRKSDLAQSGCAIFALSHALLRMGVPAEQAEPAKLAKKYALCLTVTGTNNERLIRTAAEDFGFGTQRDLITDKKKIRELLEDGCMFSFSIARGHIALISGISPDGTMVRIVDSAPTATFERIVNTAMYYEGRTGGYRVALSLSDLPGARWYFETDHYGGLEYWMPLEYAAKRGVRLIRPAEGE